MGAMRRRWAGRPGWAGSVSAGRQGRCRGGRRSAAVSGRRARHRRRRPSGIGLPLRVGREIRRGVVRRPDATPVWWHAGWPRRGENVPPTLPVGDRRTTAFPNSAVDPAGGAAGADHLVGGVLEGHCPLVEPSEGPRPGLPGRCWAPSAGASAAGQRSGRQRHDCLRPAVEGIGAGLRGRWQAPSPHSRSAGPAVAGNQPGRRRAATGRAREVR